MERRAECYDKAGVNQGKATGIRLDKHQRGLEGLEGNSNCLCTVMGELPEASPHVM